LAILAFRRTLILLGQSVERPDRMVGDLHRAAEQTAKGYLIERAARELNARKIETPAGGKGHGQTVRRLRQRLQRLASWPPPSSSARPRLFHRFDGEKFESLMHPLWTTFDVGEDHANRLFSGHASWRARTAVRREKLVDLNQRLNDADAKTVTESRYEGDMGGAVQEAFALRYNVIRAHVILARIRILTQERGRQEPKHCCTHAVTPSKLADLDHDANSY
jgi:hypothetical protein